MKTVEVSSALEMLEYIKITNKIFRKNGSQFIFRGQGNVNWSLLPKAFRPGIRFPCVLERYPEKGRTIREQQNMEYDAIEVFTDDITGSLKLENDFFSTSQNYDIGNMNIKTKVGRGEVLWPFSKAHVHLALAQHYGIPTRFMDWTYDPYVALYFAAKDALKLRNRRLKNPPKQMAIFALDIEKGPFKNFGFEEDIFSKIHDRRDRYYQFVKTSYAVNANMIAQKGVFLTYVEVGFHANERFNPLTLEQYVESSRHPETLTKYVISNDFAAEILHQLWIQFYSADKLFPGPLGKAESLFERDMWQDELGIFDY